MNGSNSNSGLQLPHSSNSNSYSSNSMGPELSRNSSSASLYSPSTVLTPPTQSLGNTTTTTNSTLTTTTTTNTSGNNINTLQTNHSNSNSGANISKSQSYSALSRTLPSGNGLNNQNSTAQQQQPLDKIQEGKTMTPAQHHRGLSIHGSTMTHSTSINTHLGSSSDYFGSPSSISGNTLTKQTPNSVYIYIHITET
jgi:hypothetical protein